MTPLRGATRFNAELAGGVEHGHQAHDAAIPLLPAPGERGERHALAGDLVDIPADILEATDSRRENRIMAGLPVRKVLDDLVSGLALVFLIELRQKAMRSSGTVRSDRG